MQGKWNKDLKGLELTEAQRRRRAKVQGKILAKHHEGFGSKGYYGHISQSGATMNRSEAERQVISAGSQMDSEQRRSFIKYDSRKGSIGGALPMNIASINVPMKPVLPTMPGPINDKTKRNFEAMRLIGIAMPELDDPTGTAYVTHDSRHVTEQASAAALPDGQNTADIKVVHQALADRVNEARVQGDESTNTHLVKPSEGLDDSFLAHQKYVGGSPRLQNAGDSVQIRDPSAQPAYTPGVEGQRPLDKIYRKEDSQGPQGTTPRLQSLAQQNPAAFATFHKQPPIPGAQHSTALSNQITGGQSRASSMQSQDGLGNTLSKKATPGKSPQRLNQDLMETEVSKLKQVQQQKKMKF